MPDTMPEPERLTDVQVAAFADYANDPLVARLAGELRTARQSQTEMLAALNLAFELSCQRSEGRSKWTMNDQRAHDAIEEAIDKAHAGGIT